MGSDVIEQVALVKGKIIHLGTGKPIVGKIRITAKQGPVVSKILDDGTFVLSGYIERLFPKLATQDYQLTLNIRADSAQFQQGNVEEPRSVTIPMVFRFDFPIDIGTVALKADRVNVRGQVTDASHGQNVFAVCAEIYFSHPIDTPVQVVKTQGIGTQRFLTTEALKGQKIIILNDRSSLMADQILRIGVGSNLEYGIIDNPTPASPDAVILKNDLAYRHMVGQTVQAVSVLPLSTPVETKLKLEINSKDRVLLLRSDKGFTPGSTIEIAGGTSAKEYQIIDPLPFVPIVGASVKVKNTSYNTTTDKLGRYRFDNIEILAGAEIVCLAAGYQLTTRPLLIDFGKLVNEENFRLAP